MIVYNNQSGLTEVYLGTSSIAEVYIGTNKVFPSDVPPTSGKVKLLSKSNMQWGNAPCNSSSTLTRDDMSTAWTDTRSGTDSNQNLIEAVVGDCVTVLGDNIFNDCYNLSAVTIPDTVTAIGNQAFHQTSNLKSITLPSNLVSIGIYAFNLSGLQMSLILPNKLETIGISAFDSCRVPNITIPSSVTAIGGTAFYQGLGTGESNPIQYVICRPTVPPTLGSGAFGDSKNTASYPIYVEDECVDAYKAATNWSNYASRIKPISEKP